MDSFFFNAAEKCFQVSEHFKHKEQHVIRVDISNGLVFFDIALKLIEEKIISVKNIDRMNFIVSVSRGTCQINDKLTSSKTTLKEKNTYLFASSRQDFDIVIEPSSDTEVFILFIADFFIKRYLSRNDEEPINFLYQKIQADISLELIHETPTDALSLYLIDKIIHAKNSDKMNSIISEHRAIEYLIHRFSLLDILNEEEHSIEQLIIATKAKNIILKSYKTPPSIKELARLCGTNDFKLKSYFKQVHKTTVYGYVQKLRLEKANVLLKEHLMSVQAVANEVGYKHQGHFSAIFFKTYGVYPKDLKNSF